MRIAEELFGHGSGTANGLSFDHDFFTFMENEPEQHHSYDDPYGKKHHIT